MTPLKNPVVFLFNEGRIGIARISKKKILHFLNKIIFFNLNKIDIRGNHDL